MTILNILNEIILRQDYVNPSNIESLNFNNIQNLVEQIINNKLIYNKEYIIFRILELSRLSIDGEYNLKTPEKKYKFVQDYNIFVQKISYLINMRNFIKASFIANKNEIGIYYFWQTINDETWDFWFKNNLIDKSYTNYKIYILTFNPDVYRLYESPINNTYYLKKIMIDMENIIIKKNN